MKLFDYFKYIKTIVINNKLRTILSISIASILIFSTTLMFLLGFNYYENLYDAKAQYLSNHNIIINVQAKSDNIDELVEYGRTYDSNNTIVSIFNCELYDFKKDKPVELIEGEYPMSGSKNIIVNKSSDCKVGDIYEYKNEELIVCGIYESNEKSLIIGDIVGNKNLIEYNNISFVFSNSINKISKIKEFYDVLSGFNPSMNKTLNNYEEMITNSTIVLIVFIVLTIILLISFIGFLSNSIIMSVNESNKLFNILHILGIKKKMILKLILLYITLIIVVSFFFGTIISYIVFCSINVNDIYNLIIPSALKKGNFEYKIKFVWYVPIFSLAFYFLYSYIYAKIIVSRNINVLEFKY